MRALIGMALLSAATLLLQVALTRVFSIAQFYHFAFLVVSLALLGFGVSGSILALWPRLRETVYSPWYALGFAVTTLAAYLFVNHLPFDSYSIAWDRNQAYLLIGNLLGLAVPFGFAGALIGSLLSSRAEAAGRVYGANLLGSAAGAVVAPFVISWIGSERAVLLCAALGVGASVILAGGRRGVARLALLVFVLGFAFVLAFPSLFEIRPSPYKRLSQFRLNPDATITATRQNAYTRLDIVESPTIHSAPGLSLTYLGDLPPQSGLLIDGDALLPVMNAPSEALALALPAAVAYALRPEGEALVLGSGGGMDAWTAVMNGAVHVTVVEPNELVFDALTRDLREWAGLADQPRVTLLWDEIRSYTQQTESQYDIVQLTLTDNYRPVSSGAFTLTENYTLTVEAFQSYLKMCGEDGLLVVNRWLQSPPSEDLRTLGLMIEALGERDPLQHIVAFRGFQVATFIVKPTPFTADETDTLLSAIDGLRYDLTLAPEMPSDMINRYARLETPIYHDLYLELATTPDRAAFYRDYDFEVSPPRDDRPFFFHFFRWEQTPDVIENLGRRWQPFGGSGYFVLIALLVFALLSALIFVLMPVLLRRAFRLALRQAGWRRALRVLGYFTAIGLAFFLVEVALIQRFILVLGRPTLALAVIIGTLLLASGIGSLMSARLSQRSFIVGLGLLIAAFPWLVDLIVPSLLALPLALRAALVALSIAPVGFLMGIPFARGIKALSEARDLIPWAWAVNGSASVISAVLAATLALSLGFTPVLLIGGLLYLLAAVLATRA